MADVLPGSTVHDPVNQVISTEEIQSLVVCITSVLSELESSVLSLYLDGRSYEEVGGAARLRHQDRRQRPPAREAQGRDCTWTRGPCCSSLQRPSQAAAGLTAARRGVRRRGARALPARDARVVCGHGGGLQPAPPPAGPRRGQRGQRRRLAPRAAVLAGRSSSGSGSSLIAYQMSHSAATCGILRITTMKKRVQPHRAAV